MSRAESQDETKSKPNRERRNGLAGELAGSLEGVPVSPMGHMETGPMRSILAAAGDDSPTAHQIAERLWELMGGAARSDDGDDGDDGDSKAGSKRAKRMSAPPPSLKKIHHRNWLANTLIALVVAGSGAFATYKATEAKAHDADQRSQTNKAAIEDLGEEVSKVKQGQEKTNDKLDQQFKVQVQLVEGVETLKKEAQTEKQKRLEEKVKRLEREKRELERERRRRGQ